MDTRTVDVPDAGPQRSGAKRRSPYWVATVWGAGIGTLACGVVALLGAATSPKNPRGFEDLAWYIWTAIFAGLAALVGGSMGTWRGLSRGGYRSPVLTGVLVVPAALVLGGLTAGIGALLAPALAVWLSQGLKAPPTADTATGRGLWPRLAITLALCGGVAFQSLAWVQGETSPRGKIIFWALALVAVGVGAPIALLRKVVPRWVIAAFVVVTLVAGFGGNLYMRYVDSQPKVTVDELARLAGDVGLPEGSEHVHNLMARIRNSDAADAPLPAVVSVAVDMRNGSNESRVLPGALSPGAGGYLPSGQAPQPPSGEKLYASDRGRQIADDWEQLLLEHGWTEELGWQYEPGSQPFWLPAPAGAVVAASDVRTFTQGLWVHAVVLPHQDGAILVMAARR